MSRYRGKRSVVAVDPTLRTKEQCTSPVRLESKLSLLHLEKPRARVLLEDIYQERMNALAVECGKVCFHKATQLLQTRVSKRSVRSREALGSAGIKTYLDGVEYLQCNVDVDLEALFGAVEAETAITGLRKQAVTFIRCVQDRDIFTQMQRDEREKRICLVEAALEERDDLSLELQECAPAIIYGAELIRNGYFAFRSTTKTKKPVETVKPAIELINRLDHFSLGQLMTEVLKHIPNFDRSSHSYKTWTIHWEEEVFHVHEQHGIVLAGFRVDHKLFVAVKNEVMEFELKDGMFILTHEKIEIPQAERLVIKNGTKLPIALHEMLRDGGIFILHGVHAAAAAWIADQAHGVGWGSNNVVFAGSAIHNMAFFLFCQRVFLATVGQHRCRDVPRRRTQWTLPPPPLTRTAVFLTTRQSDVKRVLEVVQLVERMLQLKTPEESVVMELLIALVDDWEAEAFLADFVSDVTFAVLNWGHGTGSKKEIRGVINRLWSSFASHGIRKSGEICGASVLEYEEERDKKKKKKG